MNTNVRVLSWAAICCLLLFTTIQAQDMAVQEPSVQSVMVGPIDTSIAARAAGLGETFWATDASSEYCVDLGWTVYQQCLFGTHISVTLYRNDVAIYSNTYAATGWGYGWTTTFRDYVGPGKSYTYKLQRYTTDWGWCHDTWTPTDAGSTKALQPPTNLSVTNASNSDKTISMSWSNGSELTTFYRIYENGTQIATTSSTSYTINTTPGKTANWGVATYSASYGGYNSTITQSSMSTAAYKKPENVYATQDTTVGYVELGWTCASDYATNFQIFRDDILYATVPVSQKKYLDYTVIPGTLYKYYVRSFNAPSGLYTTDPAGNRFGRAAFLNASDGGYEGKIYVNWTDFPAGYENELKLYRDGVRLEGVYSNQVEKNDEQIEPGKAHKYVLEVLKNSQVQLTISDHGFAPADGSVKGSVTTPTGAGGVKNVEVRASTPTPAMNTTLSFDGIDDYVATPPLNLASNTVTMSAWIKRSGAQTDWSAILCSRDRNTAAGIYLMSTGELRYNWNDQSNTNTWSSGLIVPEDKWTFVALTVEPDRATLYMDDSLSINIVPHALEEFDGVCDIGRDNSSATRYFKGMIDEVCVWNAVHSAEQLAFDQHHILRGNEASLIAYWRFAETDVVPDFAARGNHHGTPSGSPVVVNDSPPVWHYGTTLTNGSYMIPRINWEESTDFTIKPFKTGHGFKGSNFPQDSLVLPFTQNEHVYAAINFLDTTSIEISGLAVLNTVPAYPLPGVKVLINGSPTGEYTDSSGHFSTSVSEAGKYTIAMEYLNHAFIPSDTLLDVQDPVTTLFFRDTTRRSFSGRVYGGCNNFLGVADIRIKSLAAGYVDTTIRTDGTGMFHVTLPAQRYESQLVWIDNPDNLAILNYFLRDTVDISQHDTTHDYVYHSPPIVRISDLPAFGCGAYNVPIVEQERTYAIRIDVAEKYGAVECPAAGTVTVTDFVAYVNPDTTIALASGRAYYPLIPGYPNLSGGGVHPHQKQFIVQTTVDKYTLQDTLWFFVRGHKPRAFQFSTISPEIPLMILRDPPGDNSYSYLTTTGSASVTLGFSLESDVGIGVFARGKVGGGGEVPGVGSTGVWVGGQVEAKVGLRTALTGSQEIKISASQTLKTSDADKIVGPRGDVFLGAALNIMYALTDIVDYDTTQCTAVLDTGITWNGNGFKTTYLYTESHIRNNVIPGLQALAAVLSGSSEPAKQDSAELVLNQINVWQQVLDRNEELKANALSLPAFPVNVSFSAGTNINNSATITSTTSFSIALHLYLEAEVAAESGIKAGDFNELVAGVKVFAKLDVGLTAGTSFEVSNTVGFELADDDADPPGDVFSVDILGDPVYCTPVFKLLGGTSSCPWERGTLPRDGVGLDMNTHTASGVPPEMPAQFDLYLYNLTQSNETRTYKLSLVQGSNPDGAIISVGGAVLGDDELQFSLPPNQSDPQRATLRVAREAGSVYDYENLQVHLYSPCDSQFDTTVSFSVHFIKPCSDVRIAQPQLHWITNASHSGQMQIVLKDYDAANTSMQQLTFEYRLRGATDWTQLFAYPRTLLPADSIIYIWNMSGVAEGAYELQATTHCTLGSFSTRAHAGVYDHTPPVAFGNPQPADGSLDPGDDIKIVFTEPIDAVTANATTITMRNISTGADVPITILCKEDELVITPKTASDLILGDSMRVTITAVADPYGNLLEQPITWKFLVDRSTLVKDETRAVPTDFVLEQCHPNPFNPRTNIRFGIPKSSEVSLIVYNIKGQEVARPVTGVLSPGFYEVSFDGTQLSSGMYLYILRTDDYRSVKKMVLLK